MERDEEKVIDQNTVPAVEDNEEILNPEEETLAQTDEVIPPAPVDPVLPEIPVDTIPASTTIPLTVDETPVEEPVVDAPVEEPIPEPVADAPIEEPIPEPVAEPAIEEPVVSDVVPGAGDETPIDTQIEEPPVAVPGECPNCEGDGCPCDSGSITNLFGTMQDAVTIIWKYHLKTKKFSIHLALNDLYHQLLHYVDDVIERYQGIHGTIDDVCTNCVCAGGATEYEYMVNLKSYIENNRGLAGTESEIQSVFDDILGIIDTTIYKVNNLTESAVKSYEEFVYEDYVKEEFDSFDDIEDGDEEE